MTTTIIGPSQISEEGIAAWLACRAPRAPQGHASVIYAVANLFGVRAEVILAQQAHETGYYTFPLCGSTPFNGCAEFFNYAGIKTTDSSAIAKFESPFMGTVGQAAHLCWYATEQHVNALCSSVFDPRHFVTGSAGAPLVHRNVCKTVSELGGPGRWAPAITDPNATPPTVGYGDRIEMKIADILAFDASRLSMLEGWKR